MLFGEVPFFDIGEYYQNPEKFIKELQEAEIECDDSIFEQEFDLYLQIKEVMMFLFQKSAIVRDLEEIMLWKFKLFKDV